MSIPFSRPLLASVLVCGLLGACTPASPPVTAPTPVPTPSPEPPVVVVPTPQPEPREAPPVTPRAPLPQPSPTAPSQSAEPAAPDLPTTPVWVRVGLETDLSEVPVPCCGQTLYLRSGDRRFRVRAPLVVRPDGAATGRGHYRLQVAALRDETQARQLATRLRADTGEPADAVFDAAGGLYRVRVGRYADRPQAEAAQLRLAGRGVPSSFIVSAGADLTRAAFVVTAADRSAEPVRLTGRVLAVGTADGSPVEWQGRRYRGRLLLFLNDRGQVNLINQLDLEDYLRSVVPSEMGPELYDRPEALKAQAVAARTYVLRNLGEFRREGYDICATPRCQVYRGLASEHPRSDRAVRDTDSQVLVHRSSLGRDALGRGTLADSRYSASCGGHTENVEVVFPADNHDYLRGVPCPEAGPTTLVGRSRAVAVGNRAAFLSRRLAGATTGAASARDLERQLRAVALVAGLVPPRDHLRSLERPEVRRFLTGLLDLKLDPHLLARLDRPEQLTRLAADTPDAPDGPDAVGPVVRSQARRLLESGLFVPDPRDPTDAPSNVDQVVAAFAELSGAVERRGGGFLAVEGDTLAIRSDGTTLRYRLADDFGTFLWDGAAVSRLDLVPGDGLELLLRDNRILAVTHAVTVAESRYIHKSPHLAWRRYRSDETLRKQVADRFPGLGFSGLDLLSRGVSGRVGRMRLSGDRGRSEIVEGLAVRWTLDVPDTRFTARRATGRDGRPGYVFEGSGWGHGVGMCQIGAVNLAGRGASYRDVLGHYYTGLELVRLPPRAPAVENGAGSASPRTE